MNHLTCDHCGRELFSEAANGGPVEVPILKDTDHSTVTGHKILYLCDPTARYRPRCKTLVLKYSHPEGCRDCLWANPPGLEDRVIPEEGQWVKREQWLAATDAA